MAYPVMSFVMFFTRYSDKPLLDNIKMSWTDNNIELQIDFDVIVLLIAGFTFLLNIGINRSTDNYIINSIIIYCSVNILINIDVYGTYNNKFYNYIKI